MAGQPRDERLIGGIVLVGLGVILLLVQVVPDAARLGTLVVGLLLLGLFVVRRHFGLLVAGCIVTGVGAGVALETMVPAGEQAGGVVVLGLGVGFLAITVVAAALRMPETHWWPLIPGGILATVGALLLADQPVDELLRWWPVALVAIGLVVIGQALVRSRR